MKQSTLKWLSCSATLIILLIACKKEKGALDSLKVGRFHATCIWNQNGVQDTITGEVSGPYLIGGEHTFRMKSQLNSKATFRLIGYKSITQFFVPGYNNLDAPIISEEHDTDNLLVHFQSAGTLDGTFKLTRKE